MNDLKIYIVVNKEGKYFRSKGYGGYGETWVDDINKAKVYTKIGQARSRVSFFYNKWPEYGVANILELHSFSINTLNEEDRVLKQQSKKIESEKSRKIEAEKRKIKFAEESIRKFEEELKILKKS